MATATTIDPSKVVVGWHPDHKVVFTATGLDKATPEYLDFVRGSTKTFEDALAKDGNDVASILLHQDASRSAAAPAEEVAPAPAKITKTYIRPNGQEYLPRKMSAGVLRDVELVEKAYAARMGVLLYGPPGTGKTALADSTLENLITLAGSGDTEVGDFTGAYVQNPDGTFTWVDGPLVRAMEHGYPFFIDEIALIDSRVMAVVYSVMDGRGELNVTANPARGTVVAKDGFYILGACNPDVPGAVMSEALLSRFPIQIEVLTDFSLAKRLGVPNEMVIVAQNLARKRDGGDIMRSPQMRELLGFRDIEKEFGRELAIANLISSAEVGDRATYAEVISSAFGVKTRALTIG